MTGRIVIKSATAGRLIVLNDDLGQTGRGIIEQAAAVANRSAVAAQLGLRQSQPAGGVVYATAAATAGVIVVQADVWINSAVPLFNNPPPFAAL